MEDTAPHATTLYALLIGIDCYLPNRLPDGSYYRNLQGCVRDILRVEQFLRERMGVPADRIFKLTAANSQTGEPAEPRAQWPTYRNIVEAFRRLAEVARPGDQVYIHYSGHGGRTTTQYPELKGAHGLDEALVPVDIGDAGTQYVRDVELAYLIKRMVDKRLAVTVVLDSCHAGSATRAVGDASPRRRDDAVARGIGAIDTTERTAPSAVAPVAELVASWGGAGTRAKRGLKPGSGWLIEPSGYVLLAGCRASEFAYESTFDGKHTSGALTHWLLASLDQPAASLTYKQLYDRILPKIHAEFPEQTPQLEGEADRVVFSSVRVRPRYAVGVLRADLPNQRVLLHAGEAQGLRPGAIFAVYDPAVTDYSTADVRLALVELTELGATQSWARVIEQLRPASLEQGQQAVLLDYGATPWQSAVRLVEQTPTRHDGAHTPVLALSEVGQALAQHGRGYLRPAADGEAADYQVALGPDGEYIIRDAAGASLPNLRPAVKSGQPDAPTRLVNRLVHLTKYENVRRFGNDDTASPLAGKLFVELSPVEDSGGVPAFKVGDWLTVRIRNDHSQVLNITVLDLRPDWGITQIYPARAGLFEPLDPGQEVLLPLCAELPSGYEEGLDIIKVFATVGAPNFRWLELPALDEPTPPTDVAGTRGGLIDELEKFLRADADPPTRRHLCPSSRTKPAWSLRQLEVRIRVS